MRKNMKKTILLTALLTILIAVGCQDPKNAAPAASPVAKTERIPVEAKLLKPERFAHHVTVNGSVEAVLEAFVSPETNGQVKKIHVTEGQRVNKGQLLVSLNTDAIRSGIDEVKSGLSLARTVFERRKDLWEKKIGSEIQFLEARTNMDSLENRLKSLQAQLAMSEIKAPISGIVEKIDRKEGELAMPGMELLYIVNLQRMRVNAELAESYLGKVRANDPVEVSFSSYPDKKISARIQRISNAVNPKNRTVTIEVGLDNANESIKPNMMAALTINDFVEEQALVIPAIVIKNDMQGRYVYVLEGAGETAVARKTYIEIGMTEAGQTHVLKGLEVGGQVIVVGYNQISNGMPVRLQ
jgi:RND family efflux transporter MFP subunit